MTKTRVSKIATVLSRSGADAHLLAVEVIVRTQSLLGEITDRNADHTALARQMMRDSGAISKIDLVGNEATVRAVMSDLQALMPAQVEVLQSRVELHVRKHAIATQQPFMDGADSEIPRHVQLMKQNNLAGSTDTQLRDKLNQQFQDQERVFQAHADKQAALWRDPSMQLRALAQRQTTYVLNICELIPHSVLAARDALDLPVDAVECRQMYAELQQTVARTLPSAIDPTKSKLQGSSQMQSGEQAQKV